MNIFTFAALIALAALLPVAASGAIFWAALRDGERLTLGEVPRGFFIRGRHA
jgi:hypothetical protein